MKIKVFLSRSAAIREAYAQGHYEGFRDEQHSNPCSGADCDCNSYCAPFCSGCDGTCGSDG